MNYFLAPSLGDNGLRGEVDKRFPNRDKASDGWIGDASHQARPSSHNPCWTCRGAMYGVVTGLDVDISPDGKPNVDLRRRLLKVTIGDPRVWYVISNGVIYSRTYGFEARKYTGSNGHFAHVHISLRMDHTSVFDTSPWFTSRPLPRKSIDLSVLRNQMRRALGIDEGKIHYAHAVRYTQMALNKRYDAGLKTDGWAGEATLNAWGQHERRKDGKGRPRIPDEQSISLLVRGTRLSWKP